jgi:hypothetical protein
VFATFWILLAGVSGLYLFSAFTDPTLGGQLVTFAPPSSGETTPAVTSAESSDPELAEIKASLRELTQQVAALTARLDPDTKDPEPVPSAGPAAAEAPEPVEPAQSPAAETATAPAAPAPPPEEAPSPTQAETPSPAETPQPEATPVEQAAVDVTEPAPASPEAAPAPKPYEPPPVVVAPFEPPAEEEPAAASSEASAPPSPPAEEAEPPAPAAGPEPEPAATESAALDPIALPPAANDGSTRYGIEIGAVAKQDGLRPLWREFLTNHAALVAGLQPRRVLAPDKKWRLIAGPFGSAAEAAQACALFKKASRPCEATVYAGDSL